MPRIGLRSEEFAPTGIVKPDHPLPMPFQRLGRTHILYSVIRPQTVRIAECGDPAVGTDTGTGKNHQSFLFHTLFFQRTFARSTPGMPPHGKYGRAIPNRVGNTSATPSKALRPSALKRFVSGPADTTGAAVKESRDFQTSSGSLPVGPFVGRSPSLFRAGNAATSCAQNPNGQHATHAYLPLGTPSKRHARQTTANPTPATGRFPTGRPMQKYEIYSPNIANAHRTTALRAVRKP